MSGTPHQQEGTELEGAESLFRSQARQTAATAIAVVIVLMSALFAFITAPPQPVVLLLGILVAVIIYWAARTTGRSGLTRGGPHEERLAQCANCGSQYCVGCEERCPQCGSVHIQPDA
ncbi:MAG: hypothetical protein V3W28_04110 [Thermoplasmata archaeon]